MRFIGNKTQLLNNIKEVIDRHVTDAYSFCDIFSGTASVARFFKQWYEIYSNDILFFSYCLQRGTVENQNKPSFNNLFRIAGIENPISYLNNMSTESMEVLQQEKRFFQNNYAPKGGRMYVTDDNALRIDFTRNTVETWKNTGLISEDEYFYLVASIVEGIPFVSNISGTYGAFNKSWDSRSSKTFALIDLPVINNGMKNKSYNDDGEAILQNISGDILYIDPPYNERQYLPNYHVLETAARYDSPTLRGVTGQRNYKFERSKFCSRKTVVTAFDALLKNANFQHIILSYNTDGIMNLEEIEAIMKKYGISSTFEVNYIPYRRFKSKSIATKTEELKEMLVYIQREV